MMFGTVPDNADGSDAIQMCLRSSSIPASGHTHLAAMLRVKVREVLP